MSVRRFSSITSLFSLVWSPFVVPSVCFCVRFPWMCVCVRVRVCISEGSPSPMKYIIDCLSFVLEILKDKSFLLSFSVRQTLPALEPNSWLDEIDIIAFFFHVASIRRFCCIESSVKNARIRTVRIDIFLPPPPSGILMQRSTKQSKKQSPVGLGLLICQVYLFR